MSEDVTAGADDMYSYLVDLTGVSLDALDDLPKTALTESLRRILDEHQRQPTAYQQYQSGI